MRKNDILKAVERESIAYRGYLIRFNPFRCEWWVERDGRRIVGASSADHARKQIDELLD